MLFQTTCETPRVPKVSLRDEDYVAYLDESGENGLQVVAGVLIPARWLRGAERRWRDFIRGELGSRSGRLEVKGRDLLAGKGVSLKAQQMMLTKGSPPLSARAAGRMFYRDALEHIAMINQVRVLAVGLPTNHPLEVYRLWFWMGLCPASRESPCAPSQTSTDRHRRRGRVVSRGSGSCRPPLLSRLPKMPALCRQGLPVVRRRLRSPGQRTTSAYSDGRSRCRSGTPFDR